MNKDKEYVMVPKKFMYLNIALSTFIVVLGIMQLFIK